MYASALLSIQNLWGSLQTMRSIILTIRTGSRNSAQPLDLNVRRLRHRLHYHFKLGEI